MTEQKLERSLGPWMLWGLGVGYVISGMYFGWNLGLEKGGTYGLALATFFIVIMYLCFTFSYTELACAIPRAGGAFDYAMKALGSHWGVLGGIAQIIEFIFAPPAIAFAIGAYLNLLIPSVPVMWIAVAAYFIFTGINILGVRTAAAFELVVTIIAIVGLLLFAGAVLPSFEIKNLHQNPLPNGWTGAFAALPFAIWFFLAIEGVANVAEETINPQKNVLIGFGFAIVTLVVLCLLTFTSSVGINGWETVVYPPGDSGASDSPLPLGLQFIYGENHGIFAAVTFIGLFGLIASFHGIILAAGRATFEFGRLGLAPDWLGRVSSRFRTPANALIFNMIVGIVALTTGKTGEIITIACFGALTLYIISMISILVLRKTSPDMERPFKVPFFPYTPIIALIIAVVALVSITIYNLILAQVYLIIVMIPMIWFWIIGKKRLNSEKTEI